MATFFEAQPAFLYPIFRFCPAPPRWVGCGVHGLHGTAVIVFDHFFFPDYKHILKSWECPLTFSFVKKAQEKKAPLSGPVFCPFAPGIHSRNMTSGRGVFGLYTVWTSGAGASPVELAHQPSCCLCACLGRGFHHGKGSSSWTKTFPVRSSAL